MFFLTTKKGYILYSCITQISLAFLIGFEPYLSLICPYQEYCTRGIWPELEEVFRQNDSGNLESCCVSCSCKPDCVDYGNCCPDTGYSNKPTRELECILPVVNPDDDVISKEQAKVMTDIQRYNMVARCPIASVEYDLVAKCEGNELQYPEDLIVVADSDGHLFKNKHCAICNGVQSYTFWHLHIRGCKDENWLNYRPILPFSHFNDCMFWSEPADITLYKSSRCYISIDSCNQTGEWLFDDPYLETLCADHTMYYMHYQTTLNAFNVYKNAFCYMCNTDINNINTNPFCNFDHGNGISHILDNPTIALSALIAYPFMMDSMPNDEIRCAVDEILDPFFNKCRLLVCSPVEVPRYGQCIQQFSNIAGLTLAVTFILEDIHPNPSLFWDNWGMMLTTFLEIEEETLSCKVCKRCDFRAWTLDNGVQRNIAFQAKYKSTKSCDLECLISSLQNATSVVNRDVKIDFQFWIAKANVSVFSGDEGLLQKGFTERGKYFADCDSHVLPYNLKDMCPRIALDRYEYTSVAMKFGKSNGLFKVDKANETVTETEQYFICLRDYLHLASNGFRDRQYGLYLIITYILCLFHWIAVVTL